MEKGKIAIWAGIFVLYTVFVIFVSRSTVTPTNVGAQERAAAEKKIEELRDSLELSAAEQLALRVTIADLNRQDSLLALSLSKPQIKYEIRIKNIPLLPDDTILKLVRERYHFK